MFLNFLQDRLRTPTGVEQCRLAGLGVPGKIAVHLHAFVGRDLPVQFVFGEICRSRYPAGGDGGQFVCCESEQRTDLVKVGQLFERAFLFKTGVAAGAKPGGFGDFFRLYAEALAGLADDVADVIFQCHSGGS